MALRRFFNNKPVRLTEAFSETGNDKFFGLSFEEAFSALNTLNEAIEDEAGEEVDKKAKEDEADKTAEDKPEEESTEPTESDEAEDSQTTTNTEEEKTETSDSSFQPVYTNIDTIKNKADELPEEEFAKMESPSYSLEGEADKLYDSLINLLNKTNLPSAYEILNLVAGDDKLSKLLKHGFDAAAGEDKQVKVTITPDQSLPTNSLVPTQNVVVVSNSLDNLVNGYFVTKDKNTGDKVQNTIDYTKYFSGDAPVPQPFVYRTGNKNYIVDGHHRWSQAYCMNPYGTLKCTIINGPDIGADAVLKNFQAAIAVDPANSSLPVGSGGGMNLFKATFADLGKTVAPMTEETAEKIVSAGKDSKAFNSINEKIKGAFSKGSENLHNAKALLVSNALSLKTTVTPGKNDREIMPQADIKKVSDVLAAGAMPIETSGKK